MDLNELDFSFPKELIALRPSSPHRVMWVGDAPLEKLDPREVSIETLLEKFSTGDVLVINNTEVLRRRVFADSGLEVLFLKSLSDKRWQILMPLQKLKKKTEFELPGGVRARVVARGRPQEIETSEPLDRDYFDQYGDLPLPPYIQKARGERKPLPEDGQWYQTSWASSPGSLAAPTASLHFTKEHLQTLREKGVEVLEVTLHVGLGTFLEIASENLDEHEMHWEEIEVSADVWQKIQETKKSGGKIWALGTTVTRTLESVVAGLVSVDENGDWRGQTQLFLRPGSEFKVVDYLLTNFHQPRSSLLALLAAFAGLERVKAAYAWAVERKFQLFSYGDLSVWARH